MVPAVKEEKAGPNYALRLTEALEAISSAQGGPARDPDSELTPLLETPFAEVLEAISSDNKNRPAHRGMGAIQRKPEDTSPPEAVAATVAISRPVAKPDSPESEPAPEAEEDFDSDAPRPGFLTRVFKSLDTLPPIRLPIGPAIRWRLGLPALIVLVLAMLVLSRSWSSTSAPTVLPTAAPTPLPAPTQPLFSNPQPAPVDVSMPDPAATLQPQVAPTTVPQPLGVQDPPGMGFDILDVSLKLIAVLALVYGSLMLLKRTGLANAGNTTRNGGPASGIRLVASLALAPNRSVHVLKVPGGKTLVLGATPTQVNLIADLGELPDDQESAPEDSFFDVLKGKIAS